MRTTFAVVVGLVALLVPGTPAAAPPANDDFANATPISSLPFTDTVSLTEATTEGGEQPGCYGPSQTAWWSYRPTVDTVIGADTFGSTISGSYVVLWEATGPGLGGLASKDCAIYYSSLTQKLHAGTTYYLQAGSFYGVSRGMSRSACRSSRRRRSTRSRRRGPISSVSFSDTSADSSYATTSPDDPSCSERAPPSGTCSSLRRTCGWKRPCNRLIPTRPRTSRSPRTRDRPEV